LWGPGDKGFDRLGLAQFREFAVDAGEDVQAALECVRLPVHVGDYRAQRTETIRWSNIFSPIGQGR